VVEQSASKKEKLELAMVAFRDYPPAGNYVVRVSGFTRDPKQFGSWMDRLDFAAGGHQTVPLAEAFAAAFNVRAYPFMRRLMRELFSSCSARWTDVTD
jgi:hypothetical protein